MVRQPAAPWLPRAWLGVLVYTLFVILFGAVVRITGSGAGCGQHWPTCHGEVAHLPQSLETFIELTHRVTSGLSMLLVFGMAWLTFRRRPPGDAARRGAAWACFFMITEALVGAGLVLLELVGTDDSVPRAVVMGVHLVNTSLLTWALFLTWWSLRQAERVACGEDAVAGTSKTSPAGALPRPALFWWGAAAMVAVSSAGAVTALGDTLYPVQGTSSMEVARQVGASGVHFLERFRSVHPLLACVAAVHWIAIGARSPSPWGAAVVWITAGQVLLGLLNIWLSAPGWMQVLHLAVANLLWLAWLGAWFSSCEAAPATLPSAQGDALASQGPVASGNTTKAMSHSGAPTSSPLQ